MPLTIPSTVWSSAQSSKTMFAALPPSSSVSFLPRAGELALDCLADLGGAGERDLVDAVALDERGAGAAVAGDDVDDSGGKLGLAQDVAEEERGERGRLRRLEHDGVAARERGRDLPREHEQREVPRDDLARDADGLRPAVREGVLELVGPAGVVEEVRRGERKVDVARLLDRLAAVERLEHRELAGALLEDARDAEEVLRALGSRAAPTSRRRTPRAPRLPRFRPRPGSPGRSLRAAPRRGGRSSRTSRSRRATRRRRSARSALRSGRCRSTRAPPHTSNRREPQRHLASCRFQPWPAVPPQTRPPPLWEGASLRGICSRAGAKFVTKACLFQSPVFSRG